MRREETLRCLVDHRALEPLCSVALERGMQVALGLIDDVQAGTWARQGGVERHVAVDLDVVAREISTSNSRPGAANAVDRAQPDVLIGVLDPAGIRRRLACADRLVHLL